MKSAHSSPRGNTFRKLSQAVAHSGLLETGDRLIVGVSGGPDSMALLEVLRLLSQKRQWKLHAVHVNHLLRGPASDADEAFVCGWTQQHAIPCTTQKIDVAKYAQQHRLGLEDAARTLRYAILENTASAVGAGKIVLAHTADDQAETLLWRLLRGAVGGLAGMPARRPAASGKAEIVRPFLSVRKKDILAFLREQKIPWRVDGSNKKMDFTRNRIRHRLIPYLEKNFNPSLTDTLGAAAAALARQKEWIHGHVRAIVRRGIIHREKSNHWIAVPALAHLPVALRAEILKKAYAMAGGNLAAIKNSHIQGFLDLVGSTRSRGQILLGPVRIRREQKKIVFGPADPGAESFMPIPLLIPGTTSSALGNIETRLKAVKRTPKIPPSSRGTSKSYCEMFDWDTVTPPLTLRPRSAGDRYQPIGLDGTRKIKDILIDLKIPSYLKDLHPVLEDGTGKILWLAGHRIAEFCKVRPTTRTILTVRISRKITPSTQIGRVRGQL